jgi:hypothetical protein
MKTSRRPGRLFRSLRHLRGSSYPDVCAGFRCLASAEGSGYAE